MSEILRINTREKTYSFEEARNDLSSLGGRGLTSRIILNEVPPACHPLSKFNKLEQTCRCTWAVVRDCCCQFGENIYRC